jgi:hypothetical protein
MTLAQILTRAVEQIANAAALPFTATCPHFRGEAWGQLPGPNLIRSDERLVTDEMYATVTGCRSIADHQAVDPALERQVGKCAQQLS